MIPTAFDDDNAVLGEPTDKVFGGCEPLSVMHSTNGDGTPVVVSCWKCETPEERDELLRTGRVWLVVQGSTHPPLYLMGQKPFTVDGGNA